MEPKILRILLLMITVTVLICASAINSYGDSVEATIEYKYDEVGNIIEKKVTYTTVPGQTETNLPMTVASPGGNTYNSPLSVTLICYDASSAGCDKVYYTTDGSMPTTSSRVYSSPISISAAATLKFFAKDLAGNREAVKTESYLSHLLPHC